MNNTAKIMDNQRTISTSRFGAVEINDAKIINMTAPFLGFPDDREFILLPHAPNSPFWWLQAVNSPELAFVVIQPTLLDDSYRPKIGGNICRELQISKDEDLEILVILTIPKGRPEQMTANLLGPVVINISKKLARQVLLDPSYYSPCQPVGGAKE
ncbi:MAG: flagellar assembly protein FliW [Deltaproteobacteria bacterium]|nr:flagellar assembly protein FliW [Deltaproteobacteria bacterium]